MLDPNHLTISSALEGLYHRQFTAVELTEACLRQIDRLNPGINAFITLTPELAMEAAFQADTLIARQAGNLDDILLLGIPIALKDMIETAGTRTTAGSRFYSAHVPREDAQVALKIKLAGAVLPGKTNTHEIALGVTGVNPHYGSVRNPWNADHISGGSSSGSAAAVAAMMCLAALGTDTGGSVRIPASLCGVVGFKPTFGRISTRGVLPLSWNLDHVGMLTRCVEDAARLLQVLAGYDPHDPASIDQPVEDYGGQIDQGIRGWKIAIATGEYIGTSEAQVLVELDNAMAVIKASGARVEKVDISWISELAKANGRMVQADAATVHKEHLHSHPDWFGDDVLERLNAGAALPISQYVQDRRTQVDGQRRFEEFFERYDVLVLPSTPITAPRMDGVEAVEAARQLTRFTAPFNLTGLPAISLPCGLDEAGLPMGVQLVCRKWDEARLLQAGYAYEWGRGGRLAAPRAVKGEAG